jgi:hypothetical protein
MKRKFLSRAFNLVKQWSDGQYVVTESRWRQLMELVYPKMPRTQVELLLSVLDDQGIRAIREISLLSFVQ